VSVIADVIPIAVVTGIRIELLAITLPFGSGKHGIQMLSRVGDRLEPEFPGT
jgi:hypothetical protein